MSDEVSRQSSATLRDALAAIQLRMDEIAFEAKPMRDQLSKLDSERDKLKLERKPLEEMLSAITDGVEVSDHALVRYLERQHGHDFDAIRREMITRRARGGQRRRRGREGAWRHLQDQGTDDHDLLHRERGSMRISVSFLRSAAFGGRAR